MRSAWFAVVVVFLVSHGAYAANASARTDHRGGATLSINGAPAPSAVGFNLDLNLADIARVSGGVGGYSDALENAPRAVYNYTVAPVAYGASAVLKPFIYIFAWFGDCLDKLITTGHIHSHLSYRDFWK